MNRSTNTAPVSLSTSYLIGSPCIGISMITLQSLGTSLPAGTRSSLMAAIGSERAIIARRLRSPGTGERLSVLTDRNSVTIGDMTPLRVPIAGSLHRNMHVMVAIAAMAGAFAATAGDTAVAPFSEAPPSAAAPPKWDTLRMSLRKPPTAYQLSVEQGVVVLHASAQASVGGMIHKTRIDIGATPLVKWRWKVSAAIDGANNRIGAKEDSPARLVFAFDGDRDKLSLADRALSFVARRIAQRDLPYATLMYIFSD